MIRHAPWADAPPDFAIGLAPIEEADWLEGGEDDPAARKDALYAACRQVVFGETEGSRPGQAEVLALVERALLLTRPAGEGDRPQGGGGGVPGLGGRHSPPPPFRGPPPPFHGGGELSPLYAAARMVPDDLCLMEKRDGHWTLTAVSLSAGTFFTAKDSVGRSLALLHGPVPAFEDRFLSRVARIFDGLREGLILQRRNWTVVNTDALHAPDPAPVRAAIPAITDPASELFVRVERQTLRRLPATGGALFTIRVWTHPLGALRDDPRRLAAFAAAWRGASADLRAYKKLHLYDTLVEDFLAAS